MTGPARWIAVLLIGAIAAPLPASAELRPPGPPGIEIADPPPGWPEAPDVTASAYVLADASTGQVLAARAPDEPRPVASTVKMLTALSVLERAASDEVVEVSRVVATVGGAGVGLRPGDRWTVGQLLEGMIARSGNDAALALAVHIAGSVDAFVSLMRADAAALGLADPVLRSPTGLDDANRLTPRQLVTIARAALADHRIRAIAAKPVVDLPGIGTIASRNVLLGTYPGATGLKTGQTAAAGWSVVASAHRGDRHLVAVVLDSATDRGRFRDAAALLDHGFEAFRTVRLDRRVRLRRAGEWIDLTGPEARLLVPSAPRRVEVAVTLPETVDDGRVTAGASVTWGGRELGRAELTGSARRPAARSGAALGRWLADRAYGAMRAVTTAGGWPRAPGDPATPRP